MAPANEEYRALALRRRLTWLACGAHLDADDTAVLADGTHPTPATQARLLRCLAPTVYKLVGKGRGQLGTAPGAAHTPAPAAEMEDEPATGSLT